MYAFTKRLMDVVLSAFALVFLSPIFIVSFLCIKLSSPGPVFFCANRVGKNNIPFKMFKFRSMHLNYEKGHIITLRSDKRIFPYGSFMRKSKIDELPQLLNIIRGEMSIVGWRPEDEENVSSVFVNEFKEILDTKPGLTSPGSLYDYTHGELFENEEEYSKLFLPVKMKLELYYVRHQSFIYDIELIVRTVKTILLVILGREKFEPPKELKKI